jgi:hypothetical protein
MIRRRAINYPALLKIENICSPFSPAFGYTGVMEYANDLLTSLMLSFAATFPLTIAGASLIAATPPLGGGKCLCVFAPLRFYSFYSARNARAVTSFVKRHAGYSPASSAAITATANACTNGPGCISSASVQPNERTLMT